MSSMRCSLAAAFGLLAVAEANCPVFTDSYHSEPSPFGWPLTPGEWDFEHQECWAAKYPMCGGDRQSPMDIDLVFPGSDCTSHEESQWTGPPLDGSYKPVGGYPAVTVSKYMRSVAVSGDFGSMRLKDASGHEVEYQAEQVHLMAGSLHHVNGTGADGEMLVIHKLKVPSDSLPEYMVLSMLFREGSSGSSIFTEMGFAESGGDHHQGSAQTSWRAPSILYLNNALNDALEGAFVSYSGSVPVPPCEESVHYVVLKGIQSVGSAQLENLKNTLETHAGGFQKRRPVPRQSPGKECRSIHVNSAVVAASSTTCTQDGAGTIAACWADQCHMSPVDMQSAQASSEATTASQVSLDYKATSHLVVEPSQYSLDAVGDFGHIMVNGRLFEAKKVSFKALSQHTYDGQRYAGQLVIEHRLFGDEYSGPAEHHRRMEEDGDDFPGVFAAPHIVMVTVPLKLGRESPLLRAFGIIEAHKTTIRDAQHYDVHDPVDLSALLQPSTSKNWYWYSGGPTTPGTCTRWGTKWMVFEEPLEVSLEQINYLHVPVSGFDSTLPARSPTPGLLTKNHVPEDGAEAAGLCSTTAFRYVKPSCWKKATPICSEGKAQSPINIDTSSISQVGEVRFLPKLSWKPVSGLRITNNGEALGFDSKQLGYTTIMGANRFPKYYQVATVELRMPSEHMIDGKQYAAELQIMHKNQNTVLELDDDDVLFTSILFEIGETNKLLKQLLPEVLPHAHEYNTIEKPVELMWGLGPALNGPFFKYNGSFTSPGCEEVVQWVIFEKAMSLSEQQLRHFKALFPSPSNNRPVQPLNDRPVFKNTLQEPELVEYRFFLNREMGRNRFAKTPPGMILWPIIGTLTLCSVIMFGTFQREDPELKRSSAGGLEDDSELVTMIGRGS